MERTQIALDTNIAIDILNGNVELITSLSSYVNVFLPVTVCGELYFGAENSKSRTKNIKNLQSLLDECLILSNNVLVAEEYGRIRKVLKTKGKPIPENDIWIAACCIVNGIPLFSRDKHFSYIEGLEVVK